MNITNYKNEHRYLVAVDCIIFGFEDAELKILLIKRDFEPERGKWSLMGGFIKESETLDDAATRTLFDLTGLHNIYMEQFYAFGAIDRDPVERTISIAYYALIDIEKHNEELIEKYSAKWFSLKDAPKLIFDHNDMVEEAIQRLRSRARTQPIGFELLPESFTMLQLQQLYEAIWSKTLDKRNFINKINKLDILIKLNEKDMESSRKGSFLYMFDKQKYDRKVSEGFMFKI